LLLFSKEHLHNIFW